jgi:hypothetical protein
MPEASNEKGRGSLRALSSESVRLASYWTVKSLLETGAPLSEISTL